MSTIPSQKLPVEFELNDNDVSAELAQFSPEKWLPHVNKGVYDGNWDVLPLRCIGENADAHPIQQAFAIQQGRDWTNLPALKNLPVVQSILKQLQCELKSVRLMRLAVGAHIDPHRDPGLSVEHGEARLHIPLETNDDVDFYSDGIRLPMKVGELWYVNADREHAVRNNSAHPRINLVIDCIANEWLCGLLNDEINSK